MLDREKVIKTIEGCINDNSFCNKCDYDGCFFQHGSCEKDLLADAISLLKEQEAKPQRYDEHDIFHLPMCPNDKCNAVMAEFWHYCPYCGTRFEWDEKLDELINKGR